MSTSNLPTTERLEARRDASSVPNEDARARLLADLPIRERRLHLQGIATTVLEGGDGAPVVLLHGPGEYAAKWLRVIPALTRAHRVIAPDLPGHGNTEPIEGPVETERVLAWLDELIERTCATPPVLVGQILGGAIAARFACSRSDRIRQLVLVDALGLADFGPAPEFGSALMTFLAQPSGETHDELWRRCAFDLDMLRSTLGERWTWIREYNLDRAAAQDLHGTQQGLMAQFAISATPDDELKRITAPTTLIWGRHDLATPLAVAERASAAYGWPLHVIERCADDPPMEQPEAFLNALHAAISSERAAER